MCVRVWDSKNERYGGGGSFGRGGGFASRPVAFSFGIAAPMGSTATPLAIPANGMPAFDGAAAAAVWVEACSGSVEAVEAA